MRTLVALSLTIGSLVACGCFEEPPSEAPEGTSGGSTGADGSTGGSASGESLDSSGSSGSDDPGTSGAPGEPISLFDRACGSSNLWFAKPNISGDLEFLLACDTEGMDGARVELDEEIVLSDEQTHSKVIGVSPPRVALGGIVGDFENIDISGFQNPVLRVGLACGEGADGCLIDVGLVTYDPARPNMDLGPGDGRTVNGTSGLSLVELDIQTLGLEDVDTIGLVIFVSNAPGALLGSGDVGHLVDLRIEEE